MSLLLPLLAAAAVGQPMAYPSFPTSRDFSAVARWLERESGVARRDLVAVHDDLAWAMAPISGERLAGQPAVMRVEALDAAAWRRLGGRSAIVFLDPDCEARRATVRSADIYAASNLLGDVRRGVEPSALPVTPDALAAVALGLCRGAVPRPQPVAVAVAAPVSPPAPKPAPAPRPAPPPPAPPPVQVARPAPTIQAAPPPTPPTRPAVAAGPAAAPVSPPASVIAQAAPSPPSPPAPPPQPAPAAGPTVQIGAFGSSGAAMVAFSELVAAQPRLLAGKLQRLEPVAVQAGTLYRAVLTGFSTEAEAQAFCRALTAAGKPCVARPGP
ncbi:MAG: hypothetical protein B7Y99_03285 [Caulobacterales bacterium 32-69-10]|nr:MAG: hypothetical protein B7Y99_03285 [Caulobacterales bacterium 32-69-10]